MNTTTTDNGKKRLNILDVDAELKAFEEAERKKLGLEGSVEHWVEDMVGLNFRKSERAKITMLIGGLTIAHDYLIEGALKGIGYQVQMLVLHRRQPGSVPHHAARQVRPHVRGDRRQVRLPHGGRVRAVPLRHVRHRVPQGAP